MSMRVSEFAEVASGLEYPEGPVWLDDGRLSVVEVQGGRLRLFAASPEGSLTPQAVVDLRLPGRGNGPNGAALGPDGKLYICNNGGLAFTPVPVARAGADWTLQVPGLASADYAGGYLQRVAVPAPDGSPAPSSAPSPVEIVCSGMRSPDDLVFDALGGAWFTDWGKLLAQPGGLTRDLTGIYYLPPGSSQAVQKIGQRSAPNGILLSPAGDRLYVAETYARWIVYWDLAAPGEIKPNPLSLDGAHLLCSTIPGCGGLDSMAMDAEGNLYAVTILPQGQNPLTHGGITVVSPQGKVLEFLSIEVGRPDPLPTNLCFGGADGRTAYITLGGTGRIVSCRMKLPGLAHAWAGGGRA